LACRLMSSGRLRTRAESGAGRSRGSFTGSFAMLAKSGGLPPCTFNFSGAIVCSSAERCQWCAWPPQRRALRANEQMRLPARGQTSRSPPTTSMPLARPKSQTLARRFPIPVLLGGNPNALDSATVGGGKRRCSVTRPSSTPWSSATRRPSAPLTIGQPFLRKGMQ